MLLLKITIMFVYYPKHVWTLYTSMDWSTFDFAESFNTSSVVLWVIPSTRNAHTLKLCYWSQITSHLRYLILLTPKVMCYWEFDKIHLCLI